MVAEMLLRNLPIVYLFVAFVCGYILAFCTHNSLQVLVTKLWPQCQCQCQCSATKTTSKTTSTNPTLSTVKQNMIGLGLDMIPGLPPTNDTRLSFFYISRLYLSNKVSSSQFGLGGGHSHRYEILYEKYLPPLRDKHVKLLEFGLGCGMDYGSGASYKVWLHYFSDIELYFIDNDKQCVEKFSSDNKKAKFFIGEKGKHEFLSHFLNSSGGGFDVIVDDGSLNPDDVAKAFSLLFPALKPLGIYVTEGMLHSNVGHIHAGYLRSTTMMEMTKHFIDNMNGYGNLSGVGSLIRSIHCYYEICVYERKLGRLKENFDEFF